MNETLAETKTIAKRDLAKATTAELIGQYDKALSFGYAGRYTNSSPRQKRINLICDMICDRADNGDAEAAAWLAAS